MGTEILDRWYEGGVNPEQPVVDYFKVKTADGSVFILRYEAEADAWMVVNPEYGSMYSSLVIHPPGSADGIGRPIANIEGLKCLTFL